MSSILSQLRGQLTIPPMNSEYNIRIKLNIPDAYTGQQVIEALLRTAISADIFDGASFKKKPVNGNGASKDGKHNDYELHISGYGLPYIQLFNGNPPNHDRFRLGQSYSDIRVGYATEAGNSATLGFGDPKFDRGALLRDIEYVKRRMEEELGRVDQKSETVLSV